MTDRPTLDRREVLKLSALGLGAATLGVAGCSTAGMIWSTSRGALFG